MTVPGIGFEEVRERMTGGGVLLVDVREDEEWREGHLPGAVHAPLSEFGKEVSRSFAGREVVVYCRSGRRSARVVERLVRMGHTGVWNLEGGIEAWRGRLVKD
ncbi:MAG TPA: rhodanese-like domain-containing protein [Rubrobacteraceae bacterium]|nr:rhodanese-like domain-containing protein [Rubrobacteraceae bacterium]